ncbi:SF1B family DNA helicase RecD2 [Calidifontibacillus erzurumensis]|uniref:SF1B family DNA helicase RecD2 n=1 Tax=Calidifontibacillus erzurumensis TaxID=2741433 RepID=UPI0035B56118
METTKLLGKITKFIYKKEDFSVALFRIEKKETIIIKGNLTGMGIGEKIKLHGTIEKHPKYGKQFSVHYWERPKPENKAQLIEFLSSAIKGVGKKYAQLIVEQLGENALNIILDEGYKSLMGIQGISEKRAKNIANSIKETMGLQQIIKEVSKYGIDTDIAIKAYNIYGNDTVNKIKENPYLLMKIADISFHRADEIARNVGIGLLSKVRIIACINLVLQERCYNAGHCYIREEELIYFTKYFLNMNLKNGDEPITEDYEIIATIEEYKEIVNVRGNVYPRKLYEAEKNVAMKVSYFITTQIKERLYTKTKLTNIDEKIKEFQVKHNTVLAEKQREAIRQFMTHNFLILTGGPGTGKTFTVKGIIEIYKSLYSDKKKIVLAAPSGRAARNLYESTGIKESYTLHKLLGYRQGEVPEYNQSNPLDKDLVIVDEISMADIILASHFFDAINPTKTKVLFVGDYDQLPSIGPGNLLKDLLEAGVPSVRLTDIYRQAEASQIITNAHRINSGKQILIDQEKNDYYFLEIENPHHIAHMINKSVKRFIELGHDISEIMVLSPMKKGIIGTESLNELIQKSINPPEPTKKEVRIKRTIFREGDKVIQIKNDRKKDVYNGDLGILKAIDYDENGNEILFCSFNNQIIEYKKDEFKELQLAYATTIHKAQGSQADIVIMPISMVHERMLLRNLFYTGQTRAKKVFVLIGTRQAINKAIQTNKAVLRNTGLKEQIYNNLKLAHVSINNA